MGRYVNRGVTDEIWAVADSESSPSLRIERLNTLTRELVAHSTERYAEAAFQLKQDLWNVGQIADLIGVSERLVKRLITYHSTRSGQWNPLRKMPASVNAVDISAVVMRRHMTKVVEEVEATQDTNRD